MGKQRFLPPCWTIEAIKPRRYILYCGLFRLIWFPMDSNSWSWSINPWFGLQEGQNSFIWLINVRAHWLYRCSWFTWFVASACVQWSKHHSDTCPISAWCTQWQQWHFETGQPNWMRKWTKHRLKLVAQKSDTVWVLTSEQGHPQIDDLLRWTLDKESVPSGCQCSPCPKLAQICK